MRIWKIESKSMYFNDILDIKEEELPKLLSQKAKNEYYGEPYEIPKKGGKREIYAINTSNKLYDIQKNLCINFLSNIMLPDTVHGFKKETNYIEFLIPHIDFYGSNNYLRLDIKNFFGSISKKNIRKALKYYFKPNDKLTNESIRLILDLTIDIITYNDKVIQGAPSSPVISNLLFRQLDIRIEKYCRCFQATYTRYADDMLFSSNNEKILQDSFISGISRIISDGDFYINYSKIIRSKNKISLGGFVISDNIRLSRNKLSDLSRVLFYIENHKEYKNDTYYNDLNIFIKSQTGSESLKFSGIYSLINYLTGNRAFIISILKYSQDSNFCKKAEKIIRRLETIVLRLNNCMGK